MAFLEVEPDPSMVGWFDTAMTADGAHIGRWRSDFDGETARRIDDRYQELTSELAAQGVRIPK